MTAHPDRTVHASPTRLDAVRSLKPEIWALVNLSYKFSYSEEKSIKANSKDVLGLGRERE